MTELFYMLHKLCTLNGGKKNTMKLEQSLQSEFINLSSICLVLKHAFIVQF